MVRTFIGIALSLGLLLTVTTGGGFAQEKSPRPENAPNDTTDGTTACMAMMQDAGVAEDGRKEMREFMKSDRAPQAMAGMMEMARRMGNGDVMAGMTRMMEMMGGMGGGMMGDHGGAMPTPRPGR